MKINAAHLENYCDWSKPGAVRTGYLYKKSETSRTFQKRWFLLRDNLLFYFNHKKPSDPTTVGLIVLEGCCLERVDDLSFQLTFPGSGGRDYVLAAKTEEEVDGWMEVIAEAGFDSMQYAIKELEKQLEELVNKQSNLMTKVSNDSKHSVDFASMKTKPISAGENTARIAEIENNSSSAMDVTLDSNRSLLIFIEMHKQFGEYIEKKMQERSRINP